MECASGESGSFCAFAWSGHIGSSVLSVRRLGSFGPTIGKLASDVKRKRNFRKPTFDHSANEVCSAEGGLFESGALWGLMPI